MSAVAAELGIRAPSLYKHVAGKAAIEVGLIDVALAETGRASTARRAPPRPPPAGGGASTPTGYALTHPNPTGWPRPDALPALTPG